MCPFTLNVMKATESPTSSQIRFCHHMSLPQTQGEIMAFGWFEHLDLGVVERDQGPQMYQSLCLLLISLLECKLIGATDFSLVHSCITSIRTKSDIQYVLNKLLLSEWMDRRIHESNKSLPCCGDNLDNRDYQISQHYLFIDCKGLIGQGTLF